MVCVTKRCTAQASAAMYTELQLAPGLKLGLYSTQLHHSKGDEAGLRQAEIGAVLEDKAMRNVEMLLVAGDFQQPRQSDCEPEDWKV